MRESGTPASLNELMGKEGSKAENDFDLSDLPDLLGEKMPELPKNRLGRFRLLNALQLRFGPGFRNIPGIKKILSQFDSHVETENTIRQNLKGRMR